MAPTLAINLTLFVVLCKDKIVQYRFAMLQSLSLTSKQIPSKFQSLMTRCHYINARMQNISNVDALKVTWDDDIC